MEIVLIRHTSVDVPPGTCYGQTDVPLRTSFPEEAERVRQTLGEVSFDAVYSSPLSRCVRLAEACGFVEPQFDCRLLELDFGEWEMKRYDEIEDPRLQEWYRDYFTVAATGGESLADQRRRVSAFLDELCTRDFRRVAVFTHGGVIGCARVWAGLTPLQQLFNGIPPYGGVVTIHVPRRLQNQQIKAE